MTRRLLHSTLFPYTTLFRSGHGQGPADLEVGIGAIRDGRVVQVRYPDPHRRRDVVRHGPGERPRVRSGGDRKSTRLNSSHQITSYAVFCLQKKTTTTDPAPF